MFCKLALKNVTKSVRDYTIYFLTLMFGICLFYLFNSIDAQTAMLKISGSQKEILKTLTAMIAYVSVFISVILGFLVVYANGFLMKRRKKELGVYMTLGMPRRTISAVVILETFLIGLLSLAAGLVAGVFGAQGMSVITARLFEANLSAFVFTFSIQAFWKTLIYFGVIFLVVMVFNTVSVSHLKLIDLLKAGRKNEKLRIRRLWVSVVIFLVSVICLGSAYVLIEKNGMTRITWDFLACLILGSVGTLLFFLSLSGFLLRVVQSNKKLYYKNLNMFVLRQFNSKINTTFVSVSVICIMLLITIGTLSTGLGMSSVLSAELKAGTPYDVSFTSLKAKDILQEFKDKKVDLSRWSEQYAQVASYESDVPYGLFFTKSDWPDSMGVYSDRIVNMKLSAISVSDFNKLMKIQGKTGLSLPEDGYGINCNLRDIIPLYNRQLKAGKKITFRGQTLSAGLMKVRSECFKNIEGNSDMGTLILPDTLLENLTPREVVLNLDYKPGTGEEEFLSEVKAANGKMGIYDGLTSKTGLYKEAAGYKVLLSYLALYIGLVFLIAAAAILALQQLSEASDNVERYGLLRKLGAEEGMVNHALFVQIALYFVLPLALAVVHSVVGIHVANRLISMVGHMHILGNILLTAVIFLVIYGAYFLATYLGSRNMIREKQG